MPTDMICQFLNTRNSVSRLRSIKDRVDVWYLCARESPYTLHPVSLRIIPNVEVSPTSDQKFNRKKKTRQKVHACKTWNLVFVLVCLTCLES